MRWRDGDGPGEPDLWDEVDVAIDRIQEPLVPLPLNKGTDS